ncbi:toprim domain-containing protein [Tolypothrix campylonemoides VB511288]|nr:toprim domain-containing protein [Tolypothrix campylonemoides VB511288]
MQTTRISISGRVTVVAAYDNDTAGNETARLIKQLLPQATRLKPKACVLERGIG